MNIITNFKMRKANIASYQKNLIKNLKVDKQGNFPAYLLFTIKNLYPLILGGKYE